MNEILEVLMAKNAIKTCSVSLFLLKLESNTISHGTGYPVWIVCYRSLYLPLSPSLSLSPSYQNLQCLRILTTLPFFYPVLFNQKKQNILDYICDIFYSFCVMETVPLLSFLPLYVLKIYGCDVFNYNHLLVGSPWSINKSNRLSIQLLNNYSVEINRWNYVCVDKSILWDVYVIIVLAKIDF